MIKTKIKRDSKMRMLVNIIIVYSYIITAFLMSYFFTSQYLKTTLFYISVVLLAVLFASLAENTINPLIYFIFMFLSFFMLYFILGFRSYSAIDDPAYISVFSQVSYVGWFNYFKMTTMEPGYLILNYIVSIFTDNYLYMQLISSFIPLFLFYYGFTKYRKIISLPTAVFLLCSILYFQMLSVALVRMFIAISIIFIALRFIPQFKPFKYSLSVLLAATFHYSSLFMIILVYFAINKENLSKRATKYYTTLFIVSPIIFILVSQLLVPIMGKRYRNYGTLDVISIGTSTFTTVPLIFLLLYFYKKFNSKEQLYFKLFLVVYSLSIVISIFGGMVGLGRLIFYSYTAFILAAAMVNKLIRFTSTKFIFSYIIIFYGFLYMFYSQFTSNHHMPYFYPYKNIFFIF